MDELYHHGILGQKWHIRRFQNEDGTLTPAGRRRVQRKMNRLSRRHDKADRVYSDQAHVIDALDHRLSKNVPQWKEKRKDMRRALRRMLRSEKKLVKYQQLGNEWMKEISNFKNVDITFKRKHQNHVSVLNNENVRAKVRFTQ